MKRKNNKVIGSFDFDNYEPVGVLSIDMVMQCIKHYRIQGKSIETIYLKEKYWKEVIDWVKINDCSEDYAIHFDGVDLKKEIISLNNDPITPVFRN